MSIYLAVSHCHTLDKRRYRSEVDFLKIGMEAEPKL